MGRTFRFKGIMDNFSRWLIYMLDHFVSRMPLFNGVTLLFAITVLPKLFSICQADWDSRCFKWNLFFFSIGVIGVTKLKMLITSWYGNWWNFSRVDKGELIQAALTKTAGNKYKKTHKTDHRINRDCVINLF